MSSEHHMAHPYPTGMASTHHPRFCHSPPAVEGQELPAHLEVKDASIVLLEALSMGHHTVQELLVEREGANGSQQPAVAWRRRGSWYEYLPSWEGR